MLGCDPRLLSLALNQFNLFGAEGGAYCNSLYLGKLIRNEKSYITPQRKQKKYRTNYIQTLQLNYFNSRVALKKEKKTS